MALQQPTLGNIEALRVSGMPSFSLGAFEPAAGKPTAFDRSVVVRASTLHAPGDGSFAHYLRQTLEAQLQGAGKLEASAPTMISAELTRSEVSSSVPTAHGALAARFQVSRGGLAIYDREIAVQTDWDSSIIAAIAVPDATDHYTALYPKLVSALLTDQGFQSAVRANSQ